jgi:hypothetical protein
LIGRTENGFVTRICEFIKEELETLREDKNRLRKQNKLSLQRRLLLNLSRQFDDIVTKCEKDNLNHHAHGISERLPLELQQMISKHVCYEDEGVQIPDHNHAFLHEYESDEMRNFGEAVDINRIKKSTGIKCKLTYLRGCAIFRAEFMGLKLAQVVTQTYMESNAFHFRDPRRLMCEFLETRFPCGVLPTEHMKDNMTYVRCEDSFFLDDSGREWEYSSGNPEDLEDYPCNQIGVFEEYRGDIDFIQHIPFGKQPEATLVIVTPFDRSGTRCLQNHRILLNLMEVVLPTFRYSKNTGSSVKVISNSIKELQKKMITAPRFSYLALIIY